MGFDTFILMLYQSDRKYFKYNVEILSDVIYNITDKYI